MRNISITITTDDNRTQSYGYDPKYYADEEAQCKDIINNMRQAEATFEGHVEMVSLAAREKDKLPESKAFVSISEVIDMFAPSSDIQ